MLRFCSVFVLAFGLGVGSAAAVEIVSGPARVVDGDTLEVRGRFGPERIRIHGIDAPESGQKCRDAGGRKWACGAQATQNLKSLTQGTVTCEGRERDRYDRLVASCRVKGRDIGATMVASGWAEAYRKYSMDYVGQEKAARAAHLGIWQGDVQSPADYRADHKAQPAASAPAPSGCVIKGNISGSGRIYHVPGNQNYDKTRISPSKGERWFCTEAEARAAGWRAAKR